MILALHFRMSKRRGILPKLLKFFIDRCLGRKKLPQALRASGIDCITLGEYFGENEGQKIKDTEWLITVADNGWVALTKDNGIEELEPALKIIIENKIRYFSISDPQITWQDMVLWFNNNLEEIKIACQKPGPFVYKIYENHLEEFPLNQFPRK